MIIDTDITDILTLQIQIKAKFFTDICQFQLLTHHIICSVSGLSVVCHM